MLPACYSDPRRAIAAHVEDEHKKSLGDLIALFGAAEGGGAKCTTSSRQEHATQCPWC